MLPGLEALHHGLPDRAGVARSFSRAVSELLHRHWCRLGDEAARLLQAVSDLVVPGSCRDVVKGLTICRFWPGCCKEEGKYFQQ
jgi:hypothetical protein